MARRGGMECYLYEGRPIFSPGSAPVSETRDIILHPLRIALWEACKEDDPLAVQSLIDWYQEQGVVFVGTVGKVY